MESKSLKIGSLAIASALAIALALPALASPDDWDWIPGEYSIDSAAGSQLMTTIVTWTEVEETEQQDNVISDLGDKLHFVVVYGDPVDNIAPITIPAEDFSCDPFYIKTETISIITVHLWGILSMEEDGSGELALQDCLLDVDVLVEITGPGDTPPDDGYDSVEYENYTIYTKMGDGTSDDAGSAYVEVTMYLDVYDGYSATQFEPAEYLLTLELPMILTTGTAYVHVTDETPFPQNSTSLHCKWMENTGTLHNPTTGAGILVGATGALDVYAALPAPIIGPIDSWTDFISVTKLVIPAFYP